MNQNKNLYVPIIIGVVVIIVALVFLLGCERGEPPVQIPIGIVENTSNSPSTTTNTPTIPETTPSTTPETLVNSTPDTNNMPPPVPAEPIVPSEPTTPAFDSNVQCTDTDGGLNYTALGTVTITENGSVTTHMDYCRQATGDFKGYVYEYYCNGTSVASSNYRCPKGCSGGRCI
jgi:type IV secretory pathway VirB10-like protein